MPQWLQWFLKVAIPLVTIIIAGCALWFTISQANEQRLHNRKSVLPVIDPFSLSGPAPDGTEPGIYLLNSGIGPARLLGVGVLYKGKPLVNAAELKSLIGAQWSSLHPDDTREFRWRIWGIEFDRKFRSGTLPAGERLHILALHSECWTPDFGDFLISFFQDIAVRVKWASAYDEEFEVHWSPG
jgi:hypothetical protein